MCDCFLNFIGHWHRAIEFSVKFDKINMKPIVNVWKNRAGEKSAAMTHMVDVLMFGWFGILGNGG